MSLTCFLLSHTVRLDSVLNVSVTFCKCEQSHADMICCTQEPILLLKIDTEGYERAVIAGATALLESRKVIASIKCCLSTAVSVF